MDDINDRIVDLVDVQGLDWPSVYSCIQKECPELSEPAIRGRYYRHSKIYQPEHAPKVSGLNAASFSAGVDKAIDRAREEWREVLRERNMRSSQRISFDGGPICIVFMADVHAGSSGVDYDRVFAEAELIASAPDTYVILAGDLVDNFVIGRLKDIRLHTRLSIPDEWAIAKGLMDLLAHKIVASVSGNHENWVELLVGIDYFRGILSSVSDDALYDKDELLFVLDVGEASWKTKVRHKWRGSSMTNPTYGIEKAALFDHDFDIGVGAHTHVSGLARQFNLAGKNALAVLCGSYKVEDDYARVLGLPTPNRAACVPVVFNESGTTILFQELEDAVDYMKMVKGNGHVRKNGQKK